MSVSLSNDICFTVIVPIFNAERYLEKCIESITEQKYKNLDIVLIDDGSTDKSLEICQKYAAEDNRIVALHQERRGLVYTRKKGMALAKGDYISFVDADDYIELGMYSMIRDMIYESRPDVLAFNLKEVYTDHIEVKKNDFDSCIYNKADIRDKVIPYMICRDDFFGFGILPNLVSKVINRAFLEEIRISVSDDVTVGEDADFSYQIIAQANKLQISDIAPYCYCKRQDSMMFKALDIESINHLENDLLNCFSHKDYYELVSGQMEKYISFVKALKKPDSINAILSFFDEYDSKRCGLYGAGGFGYSIHETFRNKISCWTDTNYNYYFSLGRDVIRVDSFLENEKEYDVIFLAILNVDVCEKLKEQLITRGVRKNILFFDGFCVRA